MFDKHNNMFNKHNNNMLNKYNNMFMKIFDTQSYYALLQTPMQTHPPPPPHNKSCIHPSYTVACRKRGGGENLKNFFFAFQYSRGGGAQLRK